MFLTLGSEGESVEKLQERLADGGYDVGPVDGTFGRRTREAVVELQRETELPATGTVTAATAEELDLDIDASEVEDTRSNFARLLMRNPNYFGNQPSVNFEPATEKVGDTAYEEITCLGYDPGVSQLEAVVSVKRDAGYLGDVCTDGSIEYVRFFLDRDRTGDWEDVGVASTRVYNMPGPKPVDYTVSVELDQELDPCNSAVLPRVRAILSWGVEPPADDELGDDEPPAHSYRPVWGNRFEANIQLEPRPPTIDDIVREDLIGTELLNGMTLDDSMSFDPPQPNSSQLLMKYEETSVPPHRAGFGEFKQLLDGPLSRGRSGPGGSGGGSSGPSGPGGPSGPSRPIPSGPVPGPFPGPLPGPIPSPPEAPDVELPPGLDIDTGELVDDLFETTEDTSYEELDCVGFREGLLTAFLTIKRPSGYSGGLCTAGSPEYVAFWEKPVSGGTWTHVGTGSVTVYDMPGLPNDGLQYAVHLPSDLSHRRNPCGDGPSLVRIRAVMSWNREPPSGDPNFVPTWGNRVETLVQVPSGPAPGEGLFEVGTLGNVVPTDIDQTTGTDETGTATGPLVSSGGSVSATVAPFGGRVTITGRPDGISPSASGSNSLKYRISVKPHDAPDSAYRPLTNEFRVATYASPGTFQTMTVDSDGFYTYVPGVKQNVVAIWNTTGDGVYDLKVEAKRGDGTPVDAAAITYPDGTTEDELVIQLDNTAPEAELDITEVVPAGSTTPEPAEECGFFNVGDTVRGTFTADDEHLRPGPTGWAPYRFQVHPNGPAGGASPVERTPGGSMTVKARDGGDGHWTLDTTGMQSCGYIVDIDVTDNVVVNNSYRGHRAGENEGFCLLDPDEQVVSDSDSSDDGSGSDSSDDTSDSDEG